MKVKAVIDFNCPTHFVRAGTIVDLPDNVALPGVRAGELVAVEPEVATSRRTTTKRIKKKAE